MCSGNGNDSFKPFLIEAEIVHIFGDVRPLKFFVSKCFGCRSMGADLILFVVFGYTDKCLDDGTAEKLLRAVKVLGMYLDSWFSFVVPFISHLYCCTSLYIYICINDDSVY